MPENRNSLAMFYPAVLMVTKSLTDVDLIAMYLAAELRTDPRSAPWYEKAKILFDQYDGTEMHDLLLPALRDICKKRLGGKLPHHSFE
jgi:hypothetical protein